MRSRSELKRTPLASVWFHPSKLVSNPSGGCFRTSRHTRTATIEVVTTIPVSIPSRNNPIFSPLASEKCIGRVLSVAGTLRNTTDFTAASSAAFRSDTIPTRLRVTANLIARRRMLPQTCHRDYSRLAPSTVFDHESRHVAGSILS